MRRLGRGPKTSLVGSLALLFATCTKTLPPPGEAVYEHARQLLQSEGLQQADTEAARGLAGAPSGSELAWNFRLLRIEILLTEREVKRALAELTTAPPSSSTFKKQLARYRYCQAYAAQLSHDRAAAQTRLDEAQTLAESLSDGRLLAEIELRRAALAIDTHDAAQARQHLLKVLAYATAHDDHALRMSGTGNMGFLLLRSARYDEAIPYFEQTLAQAQALGAQTSEARVLGNLGNCFFRLGDLDKAMHFFRLAESRFAAIGNRFEMQIWRGNMANVEESTQEFNAAAADYAKALAISRELGDGSWTAVWLNNLTAVAIEREDWDSAERYNQQALAGKAEASDQGRTYSVINAGRIAEGRGRFAQAQKSFQSVLREVPDEPTALLDAHAGLAQAYAGEGRDGTAEREFQSAIAVIGQHQARFPDEQNKLTWFASVIRFYREYVQFLMERGKPLAALEVAQLSRGRVLAARLGETDSRVRLTAADLQKKAAHSGSTLLVYWIGPQTSYGWAISRAGIHYYELPGRSVLQALVNDYGSFLQQLHDPMREASAAGQSLYDKLIAPAHVATLKILLQPDGPLHSLNFATLPVTGTAAAHYWIEDAQVSIVPSFELTSPVPVNGARSLLLMGNPVAADADFPELAFAGQEMSSIQRSLPGVRQVVYSRADARPAAYTQAKPAQFSWIHFVAHATANQEEPLQSAVILSRDAGAEYRLFARNVVQIPLQADLVTISACRSAGVRVYAGEGLVGFSWAFLRSGARNVIAGLWDVNDRSTAEMMATLYGELGRGADPAEALRTAQLTLARTTGVFRKPYYWGPFEVFRAVAE